MSELYIDSNYGVLLCQTNKGPVQRFEITGVQDSKVGVKILSSFTVKLRKI